MDHRPLPGPPTSEGALLLKVTGDDQIKEGERLPSGLMKHLACRQHPG